MHFGPNSTYERPGEFAGLHMNFMANGLDVVPSEHL